ncbi:predicted protein [Histoplasma capsulatum var. duboisii H88]|uniref:Predicted protein n=1 Tax=Ajellomyces capsulatus (strain H88) TaxID=544711 RepID=F0UME5_AJEC8|nr:predicted protein [Histoplasma capsulatum var. duboisii H88]
MPCVNSRMFQSTRKRFDEWSFFWRATYRSNHFYFAFPIIADDSIGTDYSGRPEKPIGNIDHSQVKVIYRMKITAAEYKICLNANLPCSEIFHFGAAARQLSTELYGVTIDLDDEHPFSRSLRGTTLGPILSLLFGSPARQKRIIRNMKSPDGEISRTWSTKTKCQQIPLALAPAFLQMKESRAHWPTRPIESVTCNPISAQGFLLRTSVPHISITCQERAMSSQAFPHSACTRCCAASDGVDLDERPMINRHDRQPCG